MESSNIMALKLDAAYKPIAVIEAIEALVLCIVGKAKAIEEHDVEINSVSNSFKLPSVIVVNRVVKYVFSGFSPNRKNVCIRDDNTCQYCAKKLPLVELTIDHVMPRSRGGKNEWDNLVACCKKCNQKKGSKTPEEASMTLLQQPTKPKSISFKFRRYAEDIWEDYLW
jgi:5-methylcytosine-specific restriction endonuclease McrA